MLFNCPLTVSFYYPSRPDLSPCQMRTENDEVNGLRVTARECVGDAHLGLGRHDAAAEMFREGLRELKSGRCDGECP